MPSGLSWPEIRIPEGVLASYHSQTSELPGSHGEAGSPSDSTIPFSDSFEIGALDFQGEISYIYSPLISAYL